MGRTDRIQPIRSPAILFLHLVHSDFHRNKIICKFGMLHEQPIQPPLPSSPHPRQPPLPPSAFVSEAQQYEFPTGCFFFFLSNSTMVSVISTIVKLYLLVMNLILPKLKSVFELILSDQPSVFDKSKL